MTFEIMNDLILMIPLTIGKMSRIENEILQDSMDYVTVSITHHQKIISFLGLPKLGLILLYSEKRCCPEKIRISKLIKLYRPDKSIDVH